MIFKLQFAEIPEIPDILVSCYLGADCRAETKQNYFIQEKKMIHLSFDMTQ